MALSSQALEIVKIALSAASGGLLLELVRFFTSKRSRKIDETFKLSKAWQELVNEFQEERAAFREERAALQIEIDALRERQVSTETRLSDVLVEAQELRSQIMGLHRVRETQTMEISLLKNHNVGLERRVAALEKENAELRRHNASLVLQLAKSLEAYSGPNPG